MNFHNKLQTLSQDFQCSIMFPGKAGAYPSKALFRCSSVCSWPYPQTFDQAGNVCQRQKLWLIPKNNKLQTKKPNIGHSELTRCLLILLPMCLWEVAYVTSCKGQWPEHLTKSRGCFFLNISQLSCLPVGGWSLKQFLCVKFGRLGYDWTNVHLTCTTPFSQVFMSNVCTFRTGVFSSKMLSVSRQPKTLGQKNIPQFVLLMSLLIWNRYLASSFPISRCNQHQYIKSPKSNKRTLWEILLSAHQTCTQFSLVLSLKLRLNV